VCLRACVCVSAYLSVYGYGHVCMCVKRSQKDRVLLGCCVVGDKAVVLNLAACNPLVEAGAGREKSIDADKRISLTDEFHPAQEGGRRGNRFGHRNFYGQISVLFLRIRWSDLRPVSTNSVARQT
jgi:hypothetical protein